MKRCILILILIINLFSQNVTRVFVVDISGSMKKDNLHERVKNDLISYIQESTQLGDRLILMTFGTDVNPGIEDKVIQDLSETGEIINRIRNLKFVDQYTWMTKAFDIIGKRLKDLQKAYPDRYIYVYIFTDGKNEPPPGHEDEFTLAEILRKHFTTYTQEKTYVYVVTLGVQPDPIIDTLRERGMIRDVVEQPRGTEQIIRMIHISPEHFFFEYFLQEPITQRFELNISEMHNVNETTIGFEIEKKGGEYEINLSPRQIKVTKEGETFQFNFNIKGIKEQGKYSFSLKPKPGDEKIIITPSEILFEIKVGKREIELSPAKFSLNFDLKDTLEKEIELTVVKMENINQSQIRFDVEREGNFQVNIQPEVLKVNKKGENLKILIKIWNIKDKGKYSFSLIPSIDVSGASIIPDKLFFEFNVKKPFKIPLWVWLGIIGIGLVIMGIFIYHLSIPKFTNEVLEYSISVGNSTILPTEIELKTYQSPFTSTISSKKMGLENVPEFKLRIDKEGRIYITSSTKIFIGNQKQVLDENKEKEIGIGEPFFINNYKFLIKTQ